jgi:anthranilate/para-aminobenzoate synthase component I
MRLFERPVDLRPDAFELALRLSDRPGLVLLLDATGRRPSYVACDPIAQRDALDPEPNLVLDPALPTLARTPRWVGLLPYEAFRTLERPGRGRLTDSRAAPHLERLVWMRYGAVVECAERARIVGDHADAVANLARLVLREPLACPASFVLRRPVEAEALHRQRIEKALELIAAGEVYQVNLARRFELDVDGHPLGVLERWGELAKTAFAAVIRAPGADVVSSSPELFVELEADGTVRTSPIKGTRPRGSSGAADARLVEELGANAKERAELTMILDVERNDLGRVAVPGSVSLERAPFVFSLPSLHHRAATLIARLRPGVSRAELLAAMMPSGSVTGAPKVRAMELIAELEPSRRGLYTGAYGWLAHDGGLRLGMAIRVLSVRQGEGHYHAGGGIVADSDPRAEILETGWKAVQLGRLGALGAAGAG